ncbi:MAG TPA: mycothiol synthase [Dehalococcoidia bacterium]|nr:mycothiol synthase [Dehalococcoidia bacterium]
MHHVKVITRLEGQNIERLEELIEAATEADSHDPIGEHKFLRLKRGDDLAMGVLAYEESELVGYGHTLTYGIGGARRVSCEMIVHPAFRGGGIGRVLLDRIIQHAENEGARGLDMWAYNDHPAARAIAREYAFEETRRLLHMHRHPGPPPVPDRPEGAAIRAFSPGEDDEFWVSLNNRIFADHPENGSWTVADLHARMVQPWFRSEDLLMLEVDGVPAGFNWLKVAEKRREGMVGEVYIIGTSPEYHGRGLGRYLLAEGLTHLSERGVDAVAVYVDQANQRAVALYWSFEFHHHHVDVLYSLPLPRQAVRKMAEELEAAG